MQTYRRKWPYCQTKRCWRRKRARRRQICNQNTKHRSKTSPAEHRGGAEIDARSNEGQLWRDAIPPAPLSPTLPIIGRPHPSPNPPDAALQGPLLTPFPPVARPVSPGVLRSPAERLIIPLIHRPFRSHRSSLVPCATDQRSLRLTLPRPIPQPPVATASVQVVRSTLGLFGGRRSTVNRSVWRSDNSFVCGFSLGTGGRWEW